MPIQKAIPGNPYKYEPAPVTEPEIDDPLLTPSALVEGSGIDIDFDSGTGKVTITVTGGGGGGAPTDTTYITQTPSTGLSAEQALSTLSTGLLKNTTSTGVLSIAAIGTDYLAPNGDGSSLTGITQSQVSGLSAALSAKAIDTAVVHNTGAETIAGTKTFSTAPIIASLTGLVKASSGNLSTAVAGTDYLAPAGSAAALTNLKSLRPYTFVLGEGAAVTTGTNKTNALVVEYAGTIVKAKIKAKTGPTGADLIVDINLNGTSIWNSTQANRVKIAANTTLGTQTSFDTTAVAENDILTIDVDQIGSTIAGQDVTVELICLLTIT